MQQTEVVGRNVCLNIAINDWKNDAYQQCSNNNWIKPNIYADWTITQLSSTNDNAFRINGPGYIGNNITTTAQRVRPTLYLKQEVKIVNDGQDGSEGKPYELSL